MFSVIILLHLLIHFANSHTTCVESEKHFANLCFAPKLKKTGAELIQWISVNQPDDGFHTPLGNDVAQLHFAEVLKGKLLTSDDNFENMCLYFKLDHVVDEHDDGGLFGFKNLNSTWDCTDSKDNKGILRCDIKSSGFSKYHEQVNIYHVYSDNKNYFIAIFCYPNGQVGWAAQSISKTFTETEKNHIIDRIQTYGFSKDNVVTMYDETC